jgi:hypothetical protein
MANSKLRNKRYKLPKELSEIMGSDDISYEYMKKIKNHYENEDPTCKKYGGDRMKTFVENNLKSDRKNIKRRSRVKSEFGLGNGFKKSHEKDKNNFDLKNSGIKPPKVANTSSRIFNDEGIYEEVERIKSLIIYESKI